MFGAVGIGQSQVEQRLQRVALGRGAEDFFVPGFGVVYVEIGRRDVEIAHDDKRGVARDFVAKPAG